AETPLFSGPPLFSKSCRVMASLVLFPCDIGIEANGARGVHLAIKTLNLGLESGESIGAALEGFEIFDHRARSLAKPFARNNRRYARRIDDEKRGRGASLDLVDGQIVDIFAHELARRGARRHPHFGQMFGAK